MVDLQILVIGHVDREPVDALLWDPMPGGSGLLERLCQRFEDVTGMRQGRVVLVRLADEIDPEPASVSP